MFFFDQQNYFFKDALAINKLKLGVKIQLTHFNIILRTKQIHISIKLPLHAFRNVHWFI